METDILIIGTGIAGLSAALEASKLGANIVLVTRALSLDDSNTNLAQGGIIYRAKDDTSETIANDIIKAGAGLSNSRAVKALTSFGPKLVKQILIDELKVPFSKESSGGLELCKEGAHSKARIVHQADETGKAIIKQLVLAVRERKNIKILKNHTAIDLITLSHHSQEGLDIYEPPTCAGAYIFDGKKKRVVTLFAKETILATGGVGRIFLHTTNPVGARGDGIAMAYRAGVRIINMEYIQFHPTTFYHPNSERFLISEALRGAGAKLIDKNGKRFMDKYHRQSELAPRDIVSRSIHNEMLENKYECVYLDISHRTEEFIRSHFPYILKRCMEFGIDIIKDPIPVVPAAHYSCGGIYVNNFGETLTRGLSAIGEVSCSGIHGANRLASTSLLEGLVWGTLSARKIKEKLIKNKYHFPKVSSWQYEKDEIDRALLQQDWLTIKHTMTNYVGLVRTSKRLYRARESLTELNKEIEHFYRNGSLNDELIGLRNSSLVATLVLKAAILNRKSRGCHYRID